jgi:hypothetical protein
VIKENMYHPVSKGGKLGVLRDGIQSWSSGVHHPIISPPSSRRVRKTGRKVSRAHTDDTSQGVAGI